MILQVTDTGITLAVAEPKDGDDLEFPERCRLSVSAQLLVRPRSLSQPMLTFALVISRRIKTANTGTFDRCGLYLLASECQVTSR